MVLSNVIDKKACGNGDLTINQACFVFNPVLFPAQLWMKDSECYECDFELKAESAGSTAIPLIVETDFSKEFYITTGSNLQCNKTYHFEDFGIYTWNVTGSQCEDVTIEGEPESVVVNLGIAVTTYISLGVLYLVLTYISRTDWFKNFCYGDVQFRELQADLGSPGRSEQQRPHAQARARRQSRMGALDVFRGISITVMIFVNYGGGKYSMFRHIPWNGLTIADLVFPWFVWAMGISIAISLRSQLRTSASRSLVFSRLLKRSVLLIAIGVVLNSGKKGHLRLPGVLQRLGITYFVVASIEIMFVKSQRNEQFGPWYFHPEVTDSWVQWLLVIALVVVHTALSLLLPVPGCPTGYLGPGGRHNHSAQFSCTGGSAGYIDRLVFTPPHIYQHPTSEKIFASQMPYDPEGLLGTLTCVLMAFLGVHAGKIILCYGNTYSRIKRWLVCSAVTGVMAGFLCNWSQNDGVIPVNKNLWSLSYVLCAASISFFMFSVIFWIVDHKLLWSGVPFLYAGMNSIFLYLGHEILNKQLPWRWNPVTNTHAEILAMDLTATSVWLVIAYIMYRNNLFFTL